MLRTVFVASCTARSAAFRKLSFAVPFPSIIFCVILFFLNPTEFYLVGQRTAGRRSRVVGLGKKKRATSFGLVAPGKWFRGARILLLTAGHTGGDRLGAMLRSGRTDLHGGQYLLQLGEDLVAVNVLD